MKKLFFLYAVVLLSFFVLSPARYGQPRGIEQHMVTIQKNAAAFSHDEFALCLVSNVNNVITWILSSTDASSRKAIHYLSIVFLLSLLFVLGRGIGLELWAALIFMLLVVFYDFNYAGFNSLFLSHDFDGKLLAGPFIIIAFKYFLEERSWLAGLGLGAAFSLHAGMGVWFLTAIGSGIAAKILIERPWQNGAAQKDFLRFLRFFAGFLAVFLSAVSPRLFELYGQGGSTVPFIPESVQLDIFKFAWAGQASISVALVHSPAKLVLWGVVLTNVLFLIIVVRHFNVKHLNPRLQMVFYIYGGTFVFFIINELLINFFQWSAPVYLGLVRVSGFNFLCLSILLSVLIVDVYRKGRHGEFLVWMLFLANYSVIHYKHYSVAVQLVLLVCIVVLRMMGGAKLNADFLQRAAGRIIAVSAVFVILLTGLRYCQKHGSAGRTALTDYEDALQFVNRANEEHSVVLYPFARHEEFFAVSQNPGFFNSYYIVLFNSLYKYAPQLQLNAYKKFMQLEQEFGIDTIGVLKSEPSRYDRPWEESWAAQVDSAFIERWAKRYPIGYVVREKKFDPLPYTIVYENSGYRVYRRELKGGA